MQYHFYLALGMRLEVAGQRGTAVSFPPLWQWQSRWERRKFREDKFLCGFWSFTMKK